MISTIITLLLLWVVGIILSKLPFIHFKQYELVNTEKMIIRFYQEPDRCVYSFGIDYSRFEYHPLIHLRFLIWEFDMELSFITLR